MMVLAIKHPPEIYAEILVFVDPINKMSLPMAKTSLISCYRSVPQFLKRYTGIGAGFCQ